MIEVNPRLNLDATVDMLLEMKKEGKSVFCNFNGTVLYSDTITVDSAYLQVLGETKAEFEENQKKARQMHLQEKEEEEKAVENKIPYWIEIGKKYIYPQQASEWKKCVKTRARDIFNGKELDSALEIMEALSKGVPYDEINKIIYDQNHSGSSLAIVMSIVVTFSKNGPEFFEATETNISEEMQKFIDKKKKKNAKYAKELNEEKVQ